MDRYTGSMIKGMGRRRKLVSYKFEITSISSSEFIQINSMFLIKLWIRYAIYNAIYNAIDPSSL